MKKIFVFILFLFLIQTDSTYSAIPKDELVQIAQIAEQIGLDTESWEVTIREKMPINEIKSYMKHLQRSYEVHENSDKDLTTYNLTNTHKNDRISVSYKALIPSGSVGTGEFIAVISAFEWNEKTSLQYEETLNRTVDHYFSQNAHKFTCLQANKGGILNRITLFDKLTKSFNIKYQQTQLDNIHHSTTTEELYGYTDLLNEKLMILDKPMNIHIAFIHKASGKEKVIIGTPILINEY